MQRAQRSIRNASYPDKPEVFIAVMHSGISCTALRSSLELFWKGCQGAGSCLSGRYHEPVDLAGRIAVERRSAVGWGACG